MQAFVQLAAEEGTSLNPFAPEFGLILWTLLAFLVVLFVLAKKVFPKLDESLSDRERSIKEDLEKAEATRHDAEQTLEDYKSRVAQAREESNQIIDEARQAADQVRKDLTAKAETDAREIVQRAQDQLRAERERAVSELQAQLASWSADIAGKILEKELSAESHRDLVENFIRDIQEEKTQ